MATRSKTLIGVATLTLAFSATLLAANVTTATFVPPAPVAGQSVIVHLTNGANACWPPATSITRQGANVTLRLDFSDSCPVQYFLPARDYALGAFPAGTYNFQLQNCTNNPPPFPSECTITLQAPFVVTAADTPTETVPTLSSWSALGLILALVALTARRRVMNRART